MGRLRCSWRLEPKLSLGHEIPELVGGLDAEGGEPRLVDFVEASRNPIVSPVDDALRACAEDFARGRGAAKPLDQRAHRIDPLHPPGLKNLFNTVNERFPVTLTNFLKENRCERYNANADATPVAGGPKTGEDRKCQRRSSQ